MPNWKEIDDEIKTLRGNGQVKDAVDTVRKKYLGLLEKKTRRNVIAYYSGWLQKPNFPDIAINDKDKNAFMVTVNKLDRTRGLDLILHTPGGDLAATESIVDYLQSIFKKDIRAIIPQISMSAGTMIALSCNTIIMGRQSNLGPIDPQMGGLPCQGVIDEFERAQKDIKANPASAVLWQTIINKYHPTFLGACQHAIEWSEKLVDEWLVKNMCDGNTSNAKKILKGFSDHKENKSHARHISKEKCKEIGLNVIDMEGDQELQDLILSVHHAFMHTFSQTQDLKITENHLGISFVEILPVQPFGMLQMTQGQPV